MSKKTQTYDVVIIGAGPAGYVAAIRSAQLGLKTACIDNWSNPKGSSSLGGTYINAGCIPAIALLESSRLYHIVKHEAADHGIDIVDPVLNIHRMMQRKENIIAHLNQQIADVFASNNITSFHANGRLLSPNQVELTAIDSGKISVINAENVVLATGSAPTSIPCAQVDNEFILDTNSALTMTDPPKRLGIIGAGVIGFELGGIWKRLGSEVILLEAQDNFLNTADQQIAMEAFRIYTEQDLDIRLGARVIAAHKGSKKVSVEYLDQEGTHNLRLDKLVVATGRSPNTENLAAPEVDLLLDESGFVHVDEQCTTSLPGVYAIGDLTLRGPMLAHKGLEEGVFVAECIAGQETPINYNLIPSVIYTAPEIAWVGQTEQTLRARGENIKIGVFPIHATGRAQATGHSEGLVKIIADADSDGILGVHIIGENASELIAEAVLAMVFSASAEDLARTVHAHPTISEAMYEAALQLDNRALHLPPKG